MSSENCGKVEEICSARNIVKPISCSSNQRIRGWRGDVIGRAIIASSFTHETHSKLDYIFNAALRPRTLLLALYFLDLNWPILTLSFLTALRK
jgi:hypothetical protein